MVRLATITLNFIPSLSQFRVKCAPDSICIIVIIITVIMMITSSTIHVWATFRRETLGHSITPSNSREERRFNSRRAVFSTRCFFTAGTRFTILQINRLINIHNNVAIIQLICYKTLNHSFVQDLQAIVWGFPIKTIFPFPLFPLRVF